MKFLQFKYQVLKYSALIFLFFILLNSCKSKDKTDGSKMQDTGKYSDLLNNETVSSPELIYIKPNSLVFFSMSEKEFKQFLLRTGQYSEWKFEIIYKRFKRQVNNINKTLKGYKVKTIYTTEPEIAFLTLSGDTLYFNRKDNDLFIGQIFFNGKDTLYVEDGLMKNDSLVRKIKKYFNISQNINIKQAHIKTDNQSVIKKDSINKTTSDTLVAP